MNKSYHMCKIASSMTEISSEKDQRFATVKQLINGSIWMLRSPEVLKEDDLQPKMQQLDQCSRVLQHLIDSSPPPMASPEPSGNPSSQAKAIIQAILLASEIVTRCSPTIQGLVDVATEESATIAPGCIPLSMCQRLLHLLGIADRVAAMLPPDYPVANQETNATRCVVFQAMEDHVRARKAAVASIASLTLNAHKVDMLANFRTVAPCFLVTYYLMAHNDVVEAERGVDLITKYDGRLPNASNALATLVTVKNRVRMQASPSPSASSSSASSSPSASSPHFPTLRPQLYSQSSMPPTAALPLQPTIPPQPQMAYHFTQMPPLPPPNSMEERAHTQAYPTGDADLSFAGHPPQYPFSQQQQQQQQLPVSHYPSYPQTVFYHQTTTTAVSSAPIYQRPAYQHPPLGPPNQMAPNQMVPNQMGYPPNSLEQHLVDNSPSPPSFPLPSYFQQLTMQSPSLISPDHQEYPSQSSIKRAADVANLLLYDNSWQDAMYSSVSQVLPSLVDDSRKRPRHDQHLHQLQPPQHGDFFFQ